MKNILAIVSVASTLLIAGCSGTPSIDDLINDDALFEKVKKECRAIGDKPEQFKIEKCLNMHKAADKRRFK